MNTSTKKPSITLYALASLLVQKNGFHEPFFTAKPDVHVCNHLASGAERARKTLQQRSMLYFVQSYSCNCASDHLYIVFYTTIKPLNCLDLTLSREMVVFCATKHRIHSQFRLLSCIKCNVGPQVHSPETLCHLIHGHVP